MSSDQSENSNEDTELSQANKDEWINARQSFIDSLDRKIQNQPNNLKLYQQKAFLLSAQANCLEGPNQYKQLLDLSNCYHQMIELFKNIDEKNLNDESFESDNSEELDMFLDQFEEQPIEQIIDLQTNLMLNLKKMVDDANQMIIKLDQQILLDPKNYYLYLKKSQQQQTLIFGQVGKKQFFQELEKALQIFQAAIINNPNHKKLLFLKKREFCQQIKWNLDYDSLEYLETLLQNMKIYDEEILMMPKERELVLKQKVSYMRKLFQYFCVNLRPQKIEYLKKICQNCIISIERQSPENKLAKIDNLCEQAKVYMFFAKIFTENYKLLTKNNQEFQQAQKQYEKIINILNQSQSEFINQYDHRQYKLKIYKEILLSVETIFEKIQFQELICRVQEQICEISLYFSDLTKIGIIQINKVNEFEQLLKFYDKDDIEILNKMNIVYDKMIKFSLKDKDFFESQNREEFYQNCYFQKAQIYQRIAKQEKKLKQKEKYYLMALEYYEKGQKLDQSYCPLIIQRIKTLVEIPSELSLEHSWNIYYDKILQILEESQDLTVFKEFIDDGFEIILNKFAVKDQSEIIQRIFQLSNSIFILQSDISQHLWNQVFLRNKIGRILEKMGDKVKSVDNQFLYNASLEAFDQVISAQKPYPIALKDKLKLLKKLGRNLEAQNLTENFFEFQDIDSYQEKCVPLQKSSKIREAPKSNRITKKIIGHPNVQTQQRKF